MILYGVMSIWEGNVVGFGDFNKGRRLDVNWVKRDELM